MDTMNIGLIGLAVMGENLVLNMERNGYGVAVYNRTVAKVDAFVEGRAKGKNIKSNLSPTLKRVTSLSMAATPISPTRFAVQNTWKKKDCSSSAPESPVVKKVPSWALPSCRVVPRKPGPT